MPRLSLAVCLHKEGDLLHRLLERASGCFDDLVVVHDGPDETDVRSIVDDHGGRFFERPRRFQQEPHWPFAWEQARHDWILRWDADEFPSDDLRRWLEEFREGPDPTPETSAYTCVLPLWGGEKPRTTRWPRRIALIHRRRVRFFGMADQAPVPDGRVEHLNLILHHRPKQKSYGVRYTLTRPKVRRWHDEIGRALLGKPTDLPCWRWEESRWPDKWEEIRRRPLRTGLYRLVLSPIRNGRDAARCGEWPSPSLLLTFPLQHWLTCMSYRRMRRQEGALGSGELQTEND